MSKLTERKVKELMSVEARCPNGRPCFVGDNMCFNCRFYKTARTGNSIYGHFVCVGDKEAVQRHERFIEKVEREFGV